MFEDSASGGRRVRPGEIVRLLQERARRRIRGIGTRLGTPAGDVYHGIPAFHEGWKQKGVLAPVGGAIERGVTGEFTVDVDDVLAIHYLKGAREGLLKFG
jgi:hypothetical protein